MLPNSKGNPCPGALNRGWVRRKNHNFRQILRHVLETVNIMPWLLRRNVNRKFLDRSVSVPMTLNDFERRTRGAHFFQRIRTYAHTFWPTEIMQIRHGNPRGHGRVCNELGKGPIAHNFWIALLMPTAFDVEWPASGERRVLGVSHVPIPKRRCQSVPHFEYLFGTAHMVWPKTSKCRHGNKWGLGMMCFQGSAAYCTSASRGLSAMTLCAC